MSKKLSILLATSICLTGATGLFMGSMTPVKAITSVDELSDVNENHWAYEALRDLVEKYDVIEGYPDGTFRGNRTPTRWEMAAALNSLIKAVGRDLARLGAEKANKTDLQTLARLQEQFRNELTALQARTSALEARATAIEAKNDEQDNRLSLLEKTQIHGDMSFGILSDMSSAGQNAASGGGSGSGIRDAISSIGRLRLTMDVPLREDEEESDSYFGRGDLHTRMIAAFGRLSPAAAQSGNGGAFSSFSGYSRIAGDASSFNEGGIANGFTGGVNTRSNLYVENMHYKQHIKSGMPILTDWFPGMDVLPDEGWETTGDLYVGVVPWRYLYDKSPYRGNELTQFQNTSFVNTPGVAVNLSSPTVAYVWHQGLGSEDLSMDLTSGVSTVNVGDAMSGWSLTYEGRLNYNLNLGWDMPGNVYAGGYHIWDSGANSMITAGTPIVGLGGNASFAGLGTNRAGGILPNNDNNTNAFYVGWNQDWYDGIGTTVNYMLSNNSTTNTLYTSANQTTGAGQGGTGLEGISTAIKQSLSGVLHVPMSAVAPGWRDRDAFGVGLALIELQEQNMGRNGLPGQNRIDDSWEKVVEAYYKWQVNDAISVVPSVQFIMNRFGIEQNGFTSVLGLRTNYTF